MPTILQGTCDDATISLTTEFGHWELPNDPEKQNKKSLSIFLRACCHPDTGKPLFTYQQIADALGYKDRQDTNNFWRQFEASGQQFRDFLQRKMKVDDTVVEAVKAEVRKDILASAPTLCDRVSQTLGRPDLTEANIRAALEKVPCTVVRQQIRAEWEAGAWHPKERKLLEAIMQEWAEGGTKRNESVLIQIEELGTQAPDQTCDEIVQGQQAEAVTSLFTPHAAMHAISAKMRLMAVALTLYYWNVPLSRIALWMGVSKTTTYHWVIGLAVAVFPVVQSWINEGVNGVHLLIDEKWLKIRGCWWYWFVALDDETGLPLLNRLLPSQGSWTCCWFLVLIKHLGKTPRTIITDGLAAYESAIATVFQTTTHILCVFHHQQGVTAWLKRHLPDASKETTTLLKRKMKRIVQTCDPRTALRRLQALETQDAEQSWGLSSWLTTVRAKFAQLRPALRRNQSPRTTNQVERFFRAFQRFYKTRGGFHSVLSAQRELMLFVVVYVFTQQAGSGQAPIEQIVPQAKDMPFYRIINAPFRYGLANICVPNMIGDTNMATG
ncbi:MAG: DDE-type integrase/transposase/recombinase [Gammaproteobacteria bacterium]|nr:DDE-type integrase/transposase/recombinase [Gammaproteobacteria bacterium]